MSLERAMGYVPSERTYAICIRSHIITVPGALQPSPLYTVAEYAFDDDWPGFYGKIAHNSLTFTSDLASRVIEDFKEKGLDHHTLLVHCHLGKNRSPAVGIALNEIFHLGHDTEELKKTYREANWFIYNLLIETARKECTGRDSNF